MASHRMKIVIGDKAYSSWSLRAWLALRVATGTPKGFEEICVELAGAGSDAQRDLIRQHSPSGKVPALIDTALGGLVVWDSLAICEHLAEAMPEAQLWPSDLAAKARARSVSAEMHSSFAKLREHLPMNVRRHAPEAEAWRAPGVEADVDRVVEIWKECRALAAVKGGSDAGPFLFGRFSIADAMFAPVVMRFITYEPPAVMADEVCRQYVHAVSTMPEMEEWISAAHSESHRIAQYENI